MDFVTEGNFLKVPGALGSPRPFPIFLTLLLPGKLMALEDDCFFGNQWFLTEGDFALRGHLKISQIPTELKICLINFELDYTNERLKHYCLLSQVYSQE